MRAPPPATSLRVEQDRNSLTGLRARSRLLTKDVYVEWAACCVELLRWVQERPGELFWEPKQGDVRAILQRAPRGQGRVLDIGEPAPVPRSIGVDQVHDLDFLPVMLGGRRDWCLDVAELFPTIEVIHFSGLARADGTYIPPNVSIEIGSIWENLP